MLVSIYVVISFKHNLGQTVRSQISTINGESIGIVGLVACHFPVTPILYCIIASLHFSGFIQPNSAKTGVSAIVSRYTDSWVGSSKRTETNDLNMKAYHWFYNAKQESWTKSHFGLKHCFISFYSVFLFNFGRISPEKTEKLHIILLYATFYGGIHEQKGRKYSCKICSNDCEYWDKG